MWWKNSELTQCCGLTGTEWPGCLGGSVKGCLFTACKVTRERVSAATRRNSTLDHNNQQGFYSHGLSAL